MYTFGYILCQRLLERLLGLLECDCVCGLYMFEDLWFGTSNLKTQKMKIQKSEFRAWGYCEAAKPTRWGTGAYEARSLKY